MGIFNLEGRRIAITGASGGIGIAAAEICSEQGARIAICDRVSPDAEAERLGNSIFDAATVDVTDRRAVEEWAARIGPVDGLIDCAAICPFDDWEDDDWDAVARQVFDVNLGGPINLLRAFMPRMKEQGHGQIALVGSVAGKVGGVRAAPHYVMSKGGIHSFVRWAAKRGAPDNILINAIAPGVVDTPMTESQTFDATNDFPLGRKATAAEMAGPLVFLVSPAATYMSGSVVDVNGVMHFS